MRNLIFISLLTLKSIAISQIWVPATPFPDAIGSLNGQLTTINTLYTYNNEMYVGGNFTSIGGIIAHGIARWNGSNWNSLGVGNFIQNQILTDIIAYDGNLYFTAGKLYKWNGSIIQEVTYFNSSTQSNQSISGTDLHVFNNEMYIASFSRIIKFDGLNFIDVNNSNTIGSINCIDDFNNSLFAGSDEGLFKYQSGNWINCNGVSTEVPEIIDMENFNNELFVLGPSSIGGLNVNGIAKYNGLNWSNTSLPQGYYPLVYPATNYYFTNHLRKIENELYLAFKFVTTQSATIDPSPLLKYNGIQWSTLSLNYAQLGSGECVEKFNNELFCGGDFSYFNFFPGIDSAPTLINYLAKLQNTASIEKSNPNDYKIAPNPALSYITLEGDKLINETYLICDQLGRTVIAGKLNGISTEVNLSSLSKGIYTLKIEGNHQPAQIVKE